MNPAAGIDMRQRVGGLTAAIFSAPTFALPREEDLPKEEIMDFHRQPCPQCDRISDDRTEGSKLSNFGKQPGAAFGKASIDRGVWQLNSGDAAAATKSAEG